ncbi:MAG: glycosyl transferase [archaeon]|nr:glycosyl transferase [archaeon]
MQLGAEVQTDTLQSLIRSCLLELNKLKLNLTELQIQRFKANSDERIIELENLIIEKENELSILKYRSEEEIGLLTKQVEDKDAIIKNQENKIYELDYITKSLDEIKEYFAEQLMTYKREELAEVNNRLNEAYKGLAEKDAQISTLARTIDEYKIEMIKLEKDAQSKQQIIDLKRELDDKTKEIIMKNNEIHLIKQQFISKEDYFNLQQELSRKDEKIKRLEEINEFFTDLQSDVQSFNTPEKIPPFRLDRK